MNETPIMKSVTIYRVVNSYVHSVYSTFRIQALRLLAFKCISFSKRNGPYKLIALSQRASLLSAD